MKISIITSCFNREKTIRDSIESILKQDYTDIEYIIIDGASSDRTTQIIEEYKNDISLFISEPDHGMYEGINKGIKRATGDIIGLLHSDDVLYSPHVLSHIAEQFVNTNSDLVYGNGLFVDSDNLNKIVRRWISGPYHQNKVKWGWLPLHPTVYIKRDIFNLLGYYDESYKIAADSDFLVRYLYKNRLQVSYINEYIVKMRMGGASTDFKRTIQKWEEDRPLYIITIKGIIENTSIY